MSYSNQTVFPHDGRFFGEDGFITVESSELDWSPGFWPQMVVVGEMCFVKGHPLLLDEDNEMVGYVYIGRNGVLMDILND